MFRIRVQLDASAVTPPVITRTDTLSIPADLLSAALRLTALRLPAVDGPRCVGLRTVRPGRIRPRRIHARLHVAVDRGRSVRAGSSLDVSGIGGGRITAVSTTRKSKPHQRRPNDTAPHHALHRRIRLSPEGVLVLQPIRFGEAVNRALRPLSPRVPDSPSSLFATTRPPARVLLSPREARTTRTTASVPAPRTAPPHCKPASAGGS